MARRLQEVTIRMHRRQGHRHLGERYLVEGRHEWLRQISSPLDIRKIQRLPNHHVEWKKEPECYVIVCLFDLAQKVLVLAPHNAVHQGVLVSCKCQEGRTLGLDKIIRLVIPLNQMECAAHLLLHV